NMYQLYAGVDPGLWQDYQPLLWSKSTLADGTTYRAWTWISADGPEKVEPPEFTSSMMKYRDGLLGSKTGLPFASLGTRSLIQSMIGS
ncbi:hypothetical protein ACCT04_35405, partial [Rhizobium ruizarguesonis]